MPTKFDDWPKDYAENMAWRKKLLAKCARSPLFREKVRKLFFDDPIFAFNAFFFTYDTRKRPLHMQPFCTYEYQNDAILNLITSINNKRDTLIEKSRDMGVSWMVLLVFLWFWLNPAGGADFLMGSRKAEYVDKKGDMKTLFEKARYALYKLPRWLWPKGFNPDKHDNYMLLNNPETGATIGGEANNEHFGSGGRFAGILFDEFSKWESTDTSAWTSAGDSTPCRIPVSTPAGAGGKYYQLATEQEIKKLVLHWTLHSEKSAGLYCEWPKEEHQDPKLRSPWYDFECTRRTPQEIAQELDIDYLGAGNPVFDGSAGQALAWYRKNPREPVAWFRGTVAGLEQAGIPPRENVGYLVVWEQPSQGHTYVIAADVAEGKITGDFSVIKVLNRETKNVVASWYGQISENELAYVIKAVAEHFGFEEAVPWVGIETNGPGLSTFNKAVELEIPNLFMMPRYDTAKNTVSYSKGWKTNSISRNVLISGVKDYLSERIGFVDPRCVGELGTFVRNKAGKAEAKSGTHDDEVIAFGIALQVDAMSPYEGPAKAPEPMREDGVSEHMFDLEKHRLPESEHKTLEQRCFECALQNQKQRVLDEEQLGDLVLGGW